MVIKPLLTFHRAPNLNTILYKPFHDKWRFIIAPAKTIKHEHQKNIELPLHRIPLDLLDGISIFSGNFISRYAFFVKFPCDFPIKLSLNKLVAILLLHRNIIFFHLSNRGYSI